MADDSSRSPIWEYYKASAFTALALFKMAKAAEGGDSATAAEEYDRLRQYRNWLDTEKARRGRSELQRARRGSGAIEPIEWRGLRAQLYADLAAIIADAVIRSVERRPGAPVGPVGEFACRAIAETGWSSTELQSLVETIEGETLGLTGNAPRADLVKPEGVSPVEPGPDTLPDETAAEPSGRAGVEAVSESNGGKPDDDSTNRYEKLDGLTPSVRKAYFSFAYAEAVNEGRMEDKEAYEWLRENGIDASKGNAGELEDYDLPYFETWSRYLRKARKATGQRKYTPRRGKPAGGSIVRGDQIESQKPADD